MSLNDTKREMRETLDFLEPRISGIEDIQKSGGSPQLNRLLNAKVYDLKRRRNLCDLLLSEIENLLSDGYPDIPEMPITEELAEELKVQIQKTRLAHRQEIKNMEYVSGIFTQGDDKKATSITIDLGTPVNKPR